jgi:hypothetical protein
MTEFYDATKASELLKSLSLRHPDWELQTLESFPLTVEDVRIIAASKSLYTDIQTTAASSGGSTTIGALLSDIVGRAVEEKSQQIGVALESTVDLIIDGKPKAPATVLIERVAPDAAILRYHPSQ